MPWRPKLSFPIKLQGGETLRTLEDAMMVLAERSERLPLNEARRAAEDALEQAARTHLSEDIKAATEQTRDYLRSQGELGFDWMFWRFWRR